MKKFFLIAVLCVTASSITACSNTADGIERDMNKVGGKIKKVFPHNRA